MNERPTCSTLRQAFFEAAGIATCSAIGDDLLLVSAPTTYDDGDRPQFLVHVGDGLPRMEDFGNAFGRLRAGGFDPEDGSLAGYIADIIRANGLEVDQGAVSVSLREDEALSAQVSRLVTGLVQVDALRHVVRGESQSFAEQVVDWLQVNRVVPIVEPNPQVRSGPGTHKITAKIYRSIEEREADSPTYLHAVPRKVALEHAHFVFSDLSVPRVRKVAVIAPDALEALKPFVHRLAAVSAVASWAATDLLGVWLQADDQARAEQSTVLLPEAPML